MAKLIDSNELVGSDPCAFWKHVNFLDIQRSGESQSDILTLFGKLLKRKCGLRIEECGKASDTFIYLDDASFSGHRVINDLSNWITSGAPNKATIHVIVIASHRSGEYYAKKKLNQVISSSGKAIGIKRWSALRLEDRKSFTNSSDVLRPVSMPADVDVQNYVSSMTYPQKLRRPGQTGCHNMFSSDKGRQILEQEFLKMGVRIREMCPYLHNYQRPLGNSVLETLGFGTLFVTFRNCPNNAPLALWAGNPWYPLFRRKIN